RRSVRRWPAAAQSASQAAMKLWLQIYRRLDLAQRGLRFRAVAAVIALLLCAGVFGTILARTSSLDAQRREIDKVLADETLNHEAAIPLRSSGPLAAGGRPYGSPDWTSRAETIIDPATGFITAPRAYVIEELLADQKPAWVPRFLLDDPQTTWVL